jgi:SsrA-binding protein
MPLYLVNLIAMAKANGKAESKSPGSIQNRKARYDYQISDEFEAGVALLGSEVKSLYLGRGHLNDAYVRVKDGEAFLVNMDVEPYEQASVFSHERRRDRKLLLHRKEIDTMERQALEKGFTLVPLAVYFNVRGKVKIKIGVGRGKANYDKRDKIAADDARREIERAKSERY